MNYVRDAGITRLVAAANALHKIALEFSDDESARCWFRTSDPLRVKQVLYH